MQQCKIYLRLKAKRGSHVNSLTVVRRRRSLVDKLDATVMNVFLKSCMTNMDTASVTDYTSLLEYMTTA